MRKANEDEEVCKPRKIAEMLGSNVGYLALTWTARGPNTSTVILGAIGFEHIDKQHQSTGAVQEVNVRGYRGD